MSFPLRTGLAWISRILALKHRAFPALLWLAGAAHAADPTVRSVAPQKTVVLVSSAAQPEAFRYTAFPAVLRTGPDEVWVSYKAGRSHATDPGAALEVVQHRLSSGETKLLQRLVAPEPKLYQMGEFARLADGSITLNVDVQSIGWDGRHYRSGAEVFRWSAARRAFDPPARMAPVSGVLYGYPFGFITEGETTWQLIMAFGYHQPGGRWSVDALRSTDAGRSWQFVRNLTEEFGGIRGNESGFVRHGDGFIVTTRGYDKIERLHRVNRDFRVQHQVDLTGKHPFLNSYIGRPRLFIRDGQGYLIGRNWTKATGPMQLCLFRFDPETLALVSCVILDNAEQKQVTDGYYAVPVFSGEGDAARLHVITYRALNKQFPDILRFDYRWADVK
ncbi:MAG: hypothetical protein Q7S40_22015 [Opitutaceae bacterium]|nr:hypothetical protein [Opitutaceae bacterium]